MSSNETNPSASKYRLKSELARVCLPRPRAHDQRNLAWTNSICLLFLIIGLAGFRAAPPPTPAVKPLEETAPVVIETPPPPPPTIVDLTPTEKPVEQDNPIAPRLVVVTPDSPAIKFAVPTVGNLVVPNTVSVAPVAVSAPPAAPPPPPRPPDQPSRLNNTGLGGDRPAPGENDYPKMAKSLGQQGTVVMLLTADEAGLISAVEVKKSSGSALLDRHASDWVKRRWTVPPGPAGRLFQAEFTYRLN